MNINTCLQIFKNEKESSCSAKTLLYYDDNVERFLRYLSHALGKPIDQIETEDITRDCIFGYMTFLRNSNKFENHPFHINSSDKIKSTSVNTYMRALKVFMNWCIEEDFVDAGVIHKFKFLRSDEKNIIPLYQEEVEKVDALFNPKTESGLRDLCILHLMLDAGLRSGEVVSLKLKDLSFDKNLITVHGKGSKNRIVILCPTLKSKLFRYVSLYRGYTYADCYLDQPVFTQITKREFINENVIKQLFKRIKNRSGITRIYPHLCRHTFATSYIMGGGNMEMLRLLLGHFDYSITKTYLHLANQYKLMGAEIYKLDSVFFKSYY